MCSRPGRFSANVKNVSTFLQQAQSVLNCFLRGKKAPAVVERIGSDIDDSHDESPLAQLEGAGAQLPVVARSHSAIVTGSEAAARARRLLRRTMASRINKSGLPVDAIIGRVVLCFGSVISSR